MTCNFDKKAMIFGQGITLLSGSSLLRCNLKHITFAKKQEMYFYQNHAKKLIKGQIFEIGFLNI